jgi:hypothetical protein
MVSQEVVSDVYVFGIRMLTRVLSNLDGTLIVVKERNMVQSVTICHTPFRERGNKASICVPKMFKSHV